MAIERAKNFLKAYGLDNDIMEFETSSATVELAAQAIGCLEDEIAKTLSFSVGGKTVLIVASGKSRIDNAKFKAGFHEKAKMLSFDEVEEKVGHAVGGVCPFGVNEGVSVYLDKSINAHEAIFPACGSSNSAIKLTPQKLSEIITFEKWVDVCKINPQ